MAILKRLGVKMKKRTDDLKRYENELAAKSIILSIACYSTGYIVEKIISKIDDNKKKLFATGSYLAAAAVSGVILKNSINNKYEIKKVK